MARSKISKATGPWLDSLKSAVTGLGSAAHDKFASLFFQSCEINQQQLEASYRSDWIAMKVVDLPAQDATREWREWQASVQEVSDIEDLETKLSLQAKLKHALTMARLYGGGALVMGTDDGAAMDQELDPTKIKKGALKFVHALSRYELIASDVENDVMSENFRRPKAYRVAGSTVMNSAATIHPSRVVRFVGKELPNMHNINAQGWGDSSLQAVFDAVKQCGLVAASGAQLIQELKLDVIKIPGLNEQLADPDYDDRLKSRFAVAGLAKSVYNVLLLDKEEEWERINANLTGLPDVLKMYLLIASAAADIPATRFLGQSPAGLSATGESDLLNYYDSIKSLQETTIDNEMRIFNEVLVRSALGTMPDGLTTTWAPLWQMSDKDAAIMAKDKATAFKTDVDSGLIPAEILSEARIAQLIEDNVYPGLDQIIIDYEEGTLDPLVSEADLQAAAAAKAAAALPQDPNNPNAPPADPAAAKGKVPPKGSKPKPAQPKKNAQQDMAARIRSAATTVDSAPMPLYVRRDVLNAAEIIKWAKSQGFDMRGVDPTDMHVTVAYSRDPVDWIKMGEAMGQNSDGTVDVTPGGPRVVDKFGNAYVLCFTSSSLCWRHWDFTSAGASWDYNDYNPHITILKDGTRAPKDLSTVEPYRGAIKLGPEIFERLDVLA